MKKAILFIILNIYFFSYSQNKFIDSLNNVLTTLDTDTSRVIALVKLGRAYIDVGSFDSTISVCNRAISICDYYLKKNHTDKLTYLKSKSNATNNIGIVFALQSNYPKALELWQSALKIDEQIGNKTGIAARNGNIGSIYWNLKDFDKALDYFYLALKLSNDLKDNSLIAKWNGNIGNVLREKAYLPDHVLYKDSLIKEGLNFYFKALKIHEDLNDSSGIARINGNIGNVYLDFIRDNNPQGSTLDSICAKAESYIETSLMINKKIGNKFDEAIQIGNYGYLMLLKGKYSLAEENLIKALQMFKDLKALEYSRRFEQNLSNLYTQTKNYKLAYEHFVLFKLLNDSIFNIEKNKDLTQKEMSFEFEKKEALLKAEQDKKDELSKAEARKQQIIIYSVLLGLILVIIFSAFLFRLFIQKRKANILLAQQNEEINQKNEEISSQRDIVTKQKEQIEEIHKEVTDSINYAERIQRSFLATKSILDNNLREYFVLFKPKAIVSGDFYWAGMLINENFLLVTADSTGHGVPGAIMSILNISSLEKCVEIGICDPSEILNRTRENIIERLKNDGSIEGGKDGMDVSLLSINFIEKVITYAAANNPIWIIRPVENIIDDEKNFGEITTQVIFNDSFKLIELLPDKMPVGKHDKDNIPFSQNTFTFKENDIIYTLTDGYEDQFGGPKQKKFLSKNLKQLLISICNLPMADQKNILDKTLIEWIGQGEQIDDITIVGIKL